MTKQSACEQANYSNSEQQFDAMLYILYIYWNLK